jgi:hypothetical protein
MVQIGIVSLVKALILMSVMKVKIICSGMKDKQLFFYIKWVDYIWLNRYKILIYFKYSKNNSFLLFIKIKRHFIYF